MTYVWEADLFSCAICEFKYVDGPMDHITCILMGLVDRMTYSMWAWQAYEIVHVMSLHAF